MRAPPARVSARIFGNKSVVQMPRAAGMTESLCSVAAVAGIAATSASTGMRHPMMPVEHGKTSDGDASPSARAAPAHTASADATPSGAHTLLILLLITIACSAPPAASRARPTITGAPGKALRVNSAATEGVGASSAINVAVICAVRPGISAGEKENVDAPTRKPRGRDPRARSAVSYAADDENSVALAVENKRTRDAERKSQREEDIAVVGTTSCSDGGVEFPA